MTNEEKRNIYNAIQNLYNMDFTSWQEVLAMMYNLVADTSQKFEVFEQKFDIMLGSEVTKAIKELYENGKLTEIINSEVFKNLNSKIDYLQDNNEKTRKEISEQLDNKANKQEVFFKKYGININDFDEKTRQAFLEAQGIDVNYILGENAVKENNVSDGAITSEKRSALGESIYISANKKPNYNTIDDTLILYKDTVVYYKNKYYSVPNDLIINCNVTPSKYRKIAFNTYENSFRVLQYTDKLLEEEFIFCTLKDKNISCNFSYTIDGVEDIGMIESTMRTVMGDKINIISNIRPNFIYSNDTVKQLILYKDTGIKYGKKTFWVGENTTIDLTVKSSKYRLVLFDTKTNTFRVIQYSDAIEETELVFCSLKDTVIDISCNYTINGIIPIFDNEIKFNMLDKPIQNMLIKTQPSDMLPAYNARFKEIKTLYDEFMYKTGENGFAFLGIYDIHNHFSKLKYMLDEICNRINLSIILFGGDQVTDTWNITQLDRLRESIGEHKDKSIHCVGNHDIWKPQIDVTNANVYNKFIYNYSNVVTDIENPNSLYFYKDDNVNRVRYISLNLYQTFSTSNPPEVEEKQIKWLIECALTCKDDWSYVVLSHEPLISEGIKGASAQPKNGIEVLNILNAVNAKSEYTCNINGHNYTIDFRNKNNYVICNTAGHTHYDNIIKYKNINVMTSVCYATSKWSDAPDRSPDTISQYALDLFLVNKQNKEVKVLRIGAGIDRLFNY